MNFCMLFFPFPSFIRLWLGVFIFLFFLFSLAPLFCFIPVCYSVAAKRISELSVSAGVGVVLWLLCCFVLGSLILISRCLNALGWAGIISFVPDLHHFALWLDFVFIVSAYFRYLLSVLL